MAHRRLAALLLTLVMAGGLASCETDDCATGPQVFAGRIEGQIESAGMDVSPHVVIASPGYPRLFWSRLPCDTQGRFAADVPLGAYFVELTIGATRYDLSPGRIQFSGGERDTIRLSADRPVCDLSYALGGMEVQLTPPAELRNASLELYASSADPSLSRTSDGLGIKAANISWQQEGTFQFAGLLPGDYRLELEVEGNGCRERLFLPPTRDSSSVELVSVPAGQIRRCSFTVGDSGAFVSGQVTGAWQAMGKPAPRIRIYTPGGELVGEAGEPDEQGGFQFQLMYPETICLQLVQPSLSRWVGGHTPETAQRFALAPGSRLTGVEIADHGLELDFSAYSIHAPDGFDLFFLDPADSSLVHALDAGPLVCGEWVMVPNLAAGDYRLYVTNPELSQEWVAGWFDGAATYEASAALTVRDDIDVTPIEIGLRHGGQIDGRVTEASGDRVGGRLYLTDAASGGNIGQANVSFRANPFEPGDGSFTLRGIAEGQYRLGIAPRPIPYGTTAPPPDTYWYPGTFEWSAAELITITGAQHVEGIDWTYPDL